MKVTLRKILIPIGLIWFLALLIAGFLAYFVATVGPSEVTDGFGRQLTESPPLMKLAFGQERLWAGFGWFIGDMVIFWGSIGIAVVTLKWLDE